MRPLLLTLLAVYGCAAQTPPKLTLPTFTGTQPCVVVFVPTSNTGNVLTPKCLPLGSGVMIVGGVFNTVTPQPTSNLVSHVERFPLASFGPWPTDGSDMAITVTLTKPPVPGSAIMIYTTVPGYQVFAVATSPAISTQVSIIVAQSVYAAPDGVDIVVTYLATT